MKTKRICPTKKRTPTEDTLDHEGNVIKTFMRGPFLDPDNIKNSDAPIHNKKRGAFRNLDPELFEKLCHIHCTTLELEHIFDCELETISSWTQRYYGLTFKEAYEKFSAYGKASLRRLQFQMAHKNASLAIWLGKQWLNQKDTPINEEEISPELKHFMELMKEKYSKSSNK